MFKPRTLRDAIELARMRDDSLARQSRPVYPSKFTQKTSNTLSLHMSTTRPPPNAPPKWLSWVEMQKRREKGLWFGCNEKFVPDHRCQTPQVFLIEVLPQGLGDTDVFDEEDLGGAGDGHSEESPLISLHALAGCSGPRTMWVKAVIGNRAPVVLIDSGSTHNFVDQKLAHDLHMGVTPIDAFTMKVANGEWLICRERWVNEGEKLVAEALVQWTNLPSDGRKLSSYNSNIHSGLCVGANDGMPKSRKESKS
ncbi:hypothetical protein CKAN_00866600 [Cinnamomum micranthum f. kanehirae]|uniref:Uncharacterized protein n=1 Tax=Cinnamomum micranthum f. kanehirae TaxID=337451 RepID=A0A443NNF2_9MAGN|nr:hypothetical protein CKAN_00866600 [Cinnamomum micranthum f. kanehirae]